MKFFVVVGFVLLAISSLAYPQNFDGREGYIFDQSYVTRITESKASALLEIKDASDLFWKLYKKKGKTTALPKGVKKSADNLSFEVSGKPGLSLKSFVYKGTGDSGDSQRFSHLGESGKYHLVVVEFDHDSPGFILVDRYTLKVYFVNH